MLDKRSNPDRPSDETPRSKGPVDITVQRRHSSNLYSTSSPSFGIGQSLIWTALSCSYLVIQRAVTSGQPVLDRLVLELLRSILAGGAWTGVILLAHRQLSSARWPISPGCWLLFVVGVGIGLELVLATIPHSIFSRTDVVAGAAICWLFVLPLFGRAMSVHWKAFFIMMVFVHGLPLIAACSVGMGMGALDGNPLVSVALRISAPIAIGSLAVVCWQDRRRSQRHDWLHWCGVMLFALATAARLFT